MDDDDVWAMLPPKYRVGLSRAKFVRQFQRMVGAGTEGQILMMRLRLATGRQPPRKRMAEHRFVQEFRQFVEDVQRHRDKVVYPD